MKMIFKALPIVAAALFAGCNSDETNVPAMPGNDTLVKIQAETISDKDSRANIEVNGSTFSGSWEDDDAMGVLYSVPGSSDFAEPRRFVYNSSEFAFEGELPSGTGDWQYLAFYPHAEVSGKTASIPFGNLRTQQGNDFNCASDALVAEPLSFSNAERGQTDEGEPIKFRLSRLTSILNLSVKGGANAGEKVRSVLLTSADPAQLLSAKSLDFDISNMGADRTLNADAQSNVIALNFDPATAPEASDLEAFFNVLPGNYDELTFDVITDAKRMGTVTVNRSEQPFAAGKLYKKDVADMTFAKVDAPSFDWPGEDPDEVHEITADESGALTYSAAITISAPAGIKALSVNATSEFLNDMMGITTMDLFNDEAIQSILGELPFAELGLNCTTQVQYKKSTVFDITALVPLILMGGAEGSLHTFEVHVTDLAGQETVQPLTFKVPESTPEPEPAEVTYNNDANLWTNTATLTISNAALGTSVLKYQATGDEAWQTAALTANEDGTLTATIAPTWTASQNASGNTIYTVDSKTGVFAQKSYKYQLLVNGAKAAEGTFTPANNTGDAIPVFASDLSCFTPNNTAATFWGSGNNSMAASLCTFSDPYAYMLANEPLNLGILAPGNLFTGTFTFVKQGLFGATSYGTVGFGQKYTYTARPTALQLNYKISFGSKICNKYSHENELKTGDHDQASVMVCIINWDARHGVTSGNNGAPTGSWNPESLAGLSDAEKAGLIAYGAVYPDQDAASDTLLTIPLNYYDKDAGIPKGNYTVIISCSTSRYGDYLNGSKNAFYVKDFEWVY